MTSAADDRDIEKYRRLQVSSGIGQVAVACAGVASWRLLVPVGAVWFWAGAALWGVAVAMKLLCARTAGKAAIVFLQERLPSAWFVASGAFYSGVQSAFFEMGLTLLAVLAWPSMGEGCGRAIAVGVGAGAVEALLLGASAVFYGCCRQPEKNELPAPNDTPLWWLLGTFERAVALLCHASTRALLILGVVHGSGAMIFSGIALFTLLDGTAGALLLSGKVWTVSMWRVELAFLPFAVVSIPILLWCCHNYGV